MYMEARHTTPFKDNTMSTITESTKAANLIAVAEVLMSKGFTAKAFTEQCIIRFIDANDLVRTVIARAGFVYLESGFDDIACTAWYTSKLNTTQAKEIATSILAKS